MRWPACALVLLVVVGCNKEKPSEKTEAKEATPSKKQDKADPPEAKAEGAPAKKKPPAKKQPSKKADADKLAIYWKGMIEGRKATVAKKYTEAYAAFDKALDAIPDDARALSELGYAKLLAKDYKGAVADLDRAVVRTTDKKLLGQIYYNYGLAAEGRGDAGAAKAAFARSNEYNPTPAAQKKLDGKAACTAIITDKQPSSETKTFASWKAAYEDAKHDYGDLAAWSSETATLSSFCSNPWKAGASCVALLGDTALRDGRLYVPTSAGKIVMFSLDLAGGRCGGDIEAKLHEDSNGLAHVSWTTSQGVSILLAEKNGEMVPCGEKDENCTSACGDDVVTYSDLFVGKEQGESMLFIGREGESSKDPLKISVEGPVVTIKGKGCDGERPLAK